MSYKNYKVKIFTPAGRRKYLSIFKKFIYKKIKEGLVDEWMLAQNTVNISDIEYLKSMERENDRVKIYTIEEAITPTWESYNALQTHKFFKYTHDDDTIYIRFDDDIIWVEEGAIKKMIEARIDHPEAFVIVPNIINNTLFNSWHQENGALSEEFGKVKRYLASQPDLAYLDEFNYGNGTFCDHIHNTFKKHYEEGTLKAYYLPSKSLDQYQRFSICSICWFGKDKLRTGELEEPEISWLIPAREHKPNFFVGNALMVHAAYHTQRDYLRETGDKFLKWIETI
jgi:hypothetical protein